MPIRCNDNDGGEDYFVNSIRDSLSGYMTSCGFCSDQAEEILVEMEADPDLKDLTELFMYRFETFPVQFRAVIFHEMKKKALAYLDSRGRWDRMLRDNFLYPGCPPEPNWVEFEGKRHPAPEREMPILGEKITTRMLISDRPPEKNPTWRRYWCQVFCGEIPIVQLQEAENLCSEYFRKRVDVNPGVINVENCSDSKTGLRYSVANENLCVIEGGQCGFSNKCSNGENCKDPW